MSRKLSLLLVCFAVLMFGSTFVVAETAAPADSKTEVSSARCGRCGDGSCVKSCGETPESCPIDCGGIGEPSAAVTPAPAMAVTPAATSVCGGCGDGYCVTMCGETAESCPTDCGKIKPTIEAMGDDCKAKDKTALKSAAKNE
jgi:hypothetical protein